MSQGQSVVMPVMRPRLCVVAAKAFAVRANEKPNNRKKQGVYHRSLKTGVNFFQRGMGSMHGSHSVLHGRFFVYYSTGSFVALGNT